MGHGCLSHVDFLTLKDNLNIMNTDGLPNLNIVNTDRLPVQDNLNFTLTR